MSIYKRLTDIGSKYVGTHRILKFGMNISPMYRRSTGRITHISEDLMQVNLKIPISLKNRNYVNSIFGGSLFSAVDPMPMVQLMNIIGNNYVVWDKSANILFKRPAKEDVYASSTYTLEEIEEIKKRVSKEQEIEYIKVTKITNKDQTKVFCEVHKKLYIATKAHYKEKIEQRKKTTSV